MRQSRMRVRGAAGEGAGAMRMAGICERVCPCGRCVCTTFLASKGTVLYRAWTPRTQAMIIAEWLNPARTLRPRKGRTVGEAVEEYRNALLVGYCYGCGARLTFDADGNGVLVARTGEE